MKILFFVPCTRFNYKAPWTPLGAISIATYLKQHGHSVTFIDRSARRESLAGCIRRASPDVVCVSVSSVRVFDDAVRISKAAKKSALPVIWGGFFSTEYYKECLLAGYADYVSLGEGEISVLNLVNALSAGAPPSSVKGVAYLEGGAPVRTAPQPPADLRDLPILDFTVCRPEEYMHPYLFCSRMMYLYASKGCPGECAFCSNPGYHCGSYRVRPVDYVISEIRWLREHCGLDGVYFSDECWYLKKDTMREFCARLRQEGLDIRWGCEQRLGVYGEEDLQFMYDHGCRWIFFGVESGDPDMLKRIKKHITVQQIRDTVTACNRIGIVAIASFIIGYPDETPAQLQNTVDLIREINPGVSVCNMFTPIPHSEMGEALAASGQYQLPKTIEDSRRTFAGESSPYRSNTIPYRDLQVIRSSFMWQGFTKKSVSKDSKRFDILINSVREAFSNLRRIGLASFIPGLWQIARVGIPIFWYSHFYPGIQRKYKLK